MYFSPGARPARDVEVCGWRKEEAGGGGPAVSLATVSQASIQSEYTSIAELRSARCRSVSRQVHVDGRVTRVQLVLVWKLCPHDLQLRLPTPTFLSILTVTEVSWLQKTHLNVVASASRCTSVSVSPIQSRTVMAVGASQNTVFLGPSRFAALRLPYFLSAYLPSRTYDGTLSLHTILAEFC